MQHNQAAEGHLVEQYLLQEMPSPLREEFEEHFFECPECAAELRATAAFLDAAKHELQQSEPVRVAAASPVRAVAEPAKRWWSLLWTPGFAFAAAAACLLVLVYQNTIVFPKLNSEVAQLEQPAIMPELSLAGAASRGGNMPSVTVPPGQIFLLKVDIPTQPQFSGYVCRLVSPDNTVLWNVPVSPELAQNTVSLRVPTEHRAEGVYSLTVQGIQAGNSSQLVSYRFMLHS